jgi:hypothetical protein
MVPNGGNVPFLQELSWLEVEPLEIVPNQSTQDRNLETLIEVNGEVNTTVLLIREGNSPISRNCCCHCACCCGGDPQGDINCGCG